LCDSDSTVVQIALTDTEALKKVNRQSKYKAKCEADKSCMALTRSQINDDR